MTDTVFSFGLFSKCFWIAVFLWGFSHWCTNTVGRRLVVGFCSQSASSVWPFHPATWLQPAKTIMDWTLLNRFRTDQGPCHANLHKWGLAASELCECGQPQTIGHIVNSCPGNAVILHMFLENCQDFVCKHRRKWKRDVEMETFVTECSVLLLTVLVVFDDVKCCVRCDMRWCSMAMNDGCVVGLENMTRLTFLNLSANNIRVRIYVHLWFTPVSLLLFERGYRGGSPTAVQA